MKPEELRLHPRYDVSLPIDLQTVDNVDVNPDLPPLRFQSITRDLSLGGVLVDLVQNTTGLDPQWRTSWFRDRYFWLHIQGIGTIPEGLFAKARAVRFVGEDQTHPEAAGLEFQDLLESLMEKLKEFLDARS